MIETSVKIALITRWLASGMCSPNSGKTAVWVRKAIPKPTATFAIDSTSDMARDCDNRGSWRACHGRN